MSTTTLNEDPRLSFWEVGGYKPNIRRIRNGANQLDDYTKCIKERLELEQKYGKALQAWHAKWSSHVDSNVSGSIVKDLWLNILEEGREMSKSHLEVKDRCNDELVKTLGLFRKENYHYSAMRGMRESKDMDEEFEKAQRQWKKLLEKADTAKKNYHAACRNEKSTYIQLMNSQGDASTTTENTDKTRDRHEKCREVVKKTRQAYESVLREIRQFNPVYTENMTFVFEKCQQLELKRLRFAMEMLSGFQNSLADLINPLKLTQLHSSLQQKFKEITDIQLNDDLREWSKLYGVEAPLTSPLFEEYAPEFRNITGNSTMRKSNDEDCSSVILTKQTIKSNDLPGTTTIASSLQKENVRQRQSQLSSQLNSSSVKNRADSVFTDNSTKIRGPTRVYNYTPSLSQQIAMSNELNNTITTTASGRKDSEIMSYSQRKLHSESLSQKSRSDSGTSEIGGQSDDTDPVQIQGMAKVLYNYVPIEGDEIPLVKGEFIEVLSGPDKLNWCYGKKDGHEGLFPCTYVALV